jgi:small conductance mechanosensitive channel
VLILVLKPYKVGDVIEANGVTGAVTEIQIFYTVIDLPTKQRVVIPNGQLSNNLIKNYSVHETRRMDVVIGIAYDDDIDKAKSVLSEIIAADSRFLKDPAPKFFVNALGDNSVNINVRAFTTNEDYWDALGDIYETVKKRFDQEGLNFPFPQRDVHLYNEK